jgi:hypothetical protein
MEGSGSDAGSDRGIGDGDGVAACAAPRFNRTAKMALRIPRVANRTGARAPVLAKIRLPILLENIFS